MAGAAALAADTCKHMTNDQKGQETQAYVTPIAFETSGILGPLSLTFLKELCHRLSVTTGDTRSYSYLLQCLSVTIQRGSAALHPRNTYTR